MEIQFIQISQNPVTEGPIDNISVLVHGMAWGWLGGKPLCTECFNAIWHYKAAMSQMNQTGQENCIPPLMALIIT